jgi:hypothetical protein
MPQPMPYYPTRGAQRNYASYGILSAIIGLFILPELFGPIAIILGAYAWKGEATGNRGRTVIIFGIACMLVGIFFTSLIG